VSLTITTPARPTGHAPQGPAAIAAHRFRPALPVG